MTGRLEASNLKRKGIIMNFPQAFSPALSWAPFDGVYGACSSSPV